MGAWPEAVWTVKKLQKELDEIKESIENNTNLINQINKKIDSLVNQNNNN